MSYPEKRDGKATGFYYGERDLRHKGGPRFRRRFDSKKLADAYEAYIDSAGQEPPGMVDDGFTGRTFAAVAAELKAAGGPDGKWAAGRDDSVLQRLEYICGRPEGKLPIEQFNFVAAEKLVAHLKALPGQTPGSKLAPRTINNYLSAASSVLTYAEKKEYIPRSPELPWQHVPNKKKQTYTKTQATAVIGWLEAEGFKEDAFVMRVLERTGLRAGELLNLTVDQVDDEFVLLDDPEAIKNGTTRSVWIGGAMERELRTIIREGRMPKYSTLYKRVKKAIDECDYDIKRPLHTMRRTAATRTANAPGMNLHDAQTLLGHKNPNTTRGYVDVDREVLREKARKLHGADVAPAAPEIVQFRKQA